MPTSRPIARGEWLTHIQGVYIGMSHTANGDESSADYVRQEDFGIQSLYGQQYAQEACIRIFGTTWPSSEESLREAIANRTAPGLYVREGDDTSNWEEYRQVLARRVAEATGRGGVEPMPPYLRRFVPSPTIRNHDGKFVALDGGPGYTLDFDGVQVWANFGVRREISRITLALCEERVRAGFWVELPVTENSVPQTNGVALTTTTPPTANRFREDLWQRICRQYVLQDSAPNVLLEHVGSVLAGRVRFDSGPRRGMDWTLSCFDAGIHNQIITRFAVYSELKPLYALFDEHNGRFPPLPVNPTVPTWLAGLYVPDRENFTTAHLDQLAENEVIQRLVEQAGREAIQQSMGTGGVVRSQREVIPTPPAPVRDVVIRGFPSSFLAQTSSSLQASTPVPQPQPAPQQPTRFNLLEVDLPAQPSKIASKPDIDLAELQASFRLEREQKRAQAAAQAQMGRFDLIECDLPAEPVKAASTIKIVEAPIESKAKPVPKPEPVTQIADLTKARDVVELASMVARIEAEVAAELWRRETN